MTRSKSVKVPTSRYVVDPSARLRAVRKRVDYKCSKVTLNKKARTQLNVQLEKLRNYPLVSI